MTISSGYKYICIAINLVHDRWLTRPNGSSARPRSGGAQLEHAANAATQRPHEPLQASPAPSSTPRRPRAARQRPPRRPPPAAPYASRAAERRRSRQAQRQALLPKLPQLCWPPETQPVTADPSQGCSREQQTASPQASPPGRDRPEGVIDSFSVSWTTAYLHAFRATQNTCECISLSCPTESLVATWNKLAHKHNPGKEANTSQLRWAHNSRCYIYSRSCRCQRETRTLDAHHATTSKKFRGKAVSNIPLS